MSQSDPRLAILLDKAEIHDVAWLLEAWAAQTALSVISRWR